MDEEKGINVSINGSENKAVFIPMILSGATLLAVIIFFAVINHDIDRLKNRLDENSKCINDNLQSAVAKMDATESVLVRAVGEVENQLKAPEHPLPEALELRRITLSIHKDGKIFAEKFECKGVKAALNLMVALNGRKPIVVALKAENGAPVKDLLQLSEALHKSKIAVFVTP